MFWIDNYSDLLVDSRNVYILGPSEFEFAGKLQAAILAGVPQNIAAIRQDLQFVDLATVRDYAGKHPRAAKLLASIQSQSEAQNIDKAAPKKLCKANGIELRDSRGSLTIGDDQVFDFLEVPDLRRYRLELVKGTPERFKADREESRRRRAQKARNSGRVSAPDDPGALIGRPGGSPPQSVSSSLPSHE